jgi:hypothetical protein
MIVESHRPRLELLLRESSIHRIARGGRLNGAFTLMRAPRRVSGALYCGQGKAA